MVKDMVKITVSFTDEELALIQEQAELKGMQIGEYILFAAEQMQGKKPEKH